MRCLELLKKHAIYTRGAVVVLIWGTLIHHMTDYSVGYLIVGTYGPQNFAQYLLIGLPCAQIVAFQFYPLAALIGDTWSRLGVMLVGFCVQSVASVVAAALVLTMQFYEEFRSLWYVWAIVICCFGLIRLGLAVYEPNALQMGSIQMPEASSDQLSAYVHWFFWTLLFGQGLVNVLLIVLTKFLDFTAAAQCAIVYACIAQVVSIPVVFLLVWKYRQLLSITYELKNPLKQIRNVVRYAVKHKYPVHRSAFAYGELPARIDLGKDRYGGPFTTEQVEDVKSFFRIFLLIISLTGFRFEDESSVTSNHLRIVLMEHNQTAGYGFDFITVQVFGMSIFVIFIGIPVYQLLVKPLFHRFLTTMLKRIFIGLILQLIILCVLQALEGTMADHIETSYHTDVCTYYHNASNFRQSMVQNITLPIHYQWVIIPQVLTGATFLLVFLTVFEFILAQSPYSMQGLLIGIWYCSYTVTLVIVVIEQIICFVWLTSIKIGLALAFTVIYVAVALKYRRRVREEPTEHNRQQVVENVYEKYIMQRDSEPVKYDSIAVTVEEL